MSRTGRNRIRSLSYAMALMLAPISLLLSAPAAVASRAEITRPHGQARGVVLVLHGGGWFSGRLGEVRPAARRMTSRGWIAVNYPYEPGAASVLDVRREYRRIRRRWPRLSVCAYGESSGGHLALMLAVRYRTLACVISVGAPTDLHAWWQGRWLTMFPHASPAFLPLRAQRVLLVHLKSDWIVPVSQAYTYRRRHRHRVRALYLDGIWPVTSTTATWAIPMMHGFVTELEWSRYRAAEARTLRSASRSHAGRR